MVIINHKMDHIKRKEMNASQQGILNYNDKFDCCLYRKSLFRISGQLGFLR